MTDLPRGWDIFAVGSSTTATTVTVPAAPGICHVVTAVNVTVAVTAAQAVGNVQVSNTVALSTLGFIGPFDTPGASGWDVLTFNWQGEFMGLPGDLVEALVNLAPPGGTISLEIQGYDI